MTGAAVSIEVEGTQRLASTLAGAGRELEHPEAIPDAGRVVQMRANAAAPKLSGALARSIRAEVEGEAVTVGTDLAYAGVHEYGWAARGITAHPYLRPALEGSTDTVLGLFERDAKHALGAVKGA